MENKLTIPEYAKLKVYWDDKTENYSRESKLKVRNYFAKKYEVEKTSVNVIYRPIKIGKDGEVIEITGAGIDNILDRNYQVELMKKWYERNNKTVDFNRLMALDTKVNGSLSEDGDSSNHRSWSLKWLYLDNFLCFGDANYASFQNLNGLNIVTSEPPNQGGKTTFSVDAIKFLLFGNTTKTTVNGDIFNTFREKNTLTVRGMLDVEGQEVIIERILTRTAKRAGGWNVTNKLLYYDLLPDGEEKVKNEEDSKKTTELIKATIGNEKDFDITILATARNLQDLVDAKATESGKLLTKFIGLEILEKKEAIAKDIYKEFNKTKKSNIYNATTLLEEIELKTGNITVFQTDVIDQESNLVKINSKLELLNKTRDVLLTSKVNVDIIISQLNPLTIEKDIEDITQKGVGYGKKIKELNVEIETLSKITYDEDLFHKLTKDFTDLTIKSGKLDNEILAIGKLIDNLENSEICQTCKRTLEDVDNSQAIKQSKNELEGKEIELKQTKSDLLVVTKNKTSVNENRTIVDNRNRLELSRDKYEVDITSLRNQIKVKKTDLKNYKANEDAIKKNLDVDSEVSAVKTNIIVEEKNKTDVTRENYITNTEIEKANVVITSNKSIIIALKKEEDVEKIFKVYLEMIGKKGISKLVLRSVMPIINSELQRLLDDVCDFEVELVMNDKNDVEYLLIQGEVEKSLKSGSGFELTLASIALRCVLGKISHLPMPNFISFDEVLGRVAAINIEKMKPMFEKIKDMYDIVFLITHNDLVKDWGDRVIMIKKENNVSKINVK